MIRSHITNHYDRGEDLGMEVGMDVVYDSKIYTIVHIYNSGYCEIKEKNKHTILLVKLSELSIRE